MQRQNVNKLKIQTCGPQQQDKKRGSKWVQELVKLCVQFTMHVLSTWCESGPLLVKGMEKLSHREALSSGCSAGSEVGTVINRYQGSSELADGDPHFGHF